MNDQRSEDDQKEEGVDPAREGEHTPSPEEAGETAGHDASEDGTPENGTDDAAGPEDGEAETPAESPGGEDGGSDDGGDEAGGQPAPPPKRRGGRLVAALALLVALAAAGAAGYLGWRLYRLEQRVADIPAERAQAIRPLAEQSSLDALEGRFDRKLQQAVDDKAKSLISARDEALSRLRSRIDTLEAGVAGIRELAARDQVSWRLAEIRYLLSIAQRRVLIARDTRSAIAALESADRAIAELGSVRLLPLRQRIVDDLTALRSVEPADIEGIALRLQNLLGRVPDLPAAGEARTAATGGGGPSGWWGELKDRLGDYVSIRRRDAGPARGRPQPETDLPQADRLVLALQRARQAALAGDGTAYERALSQADATLASGFAAEAPATERFREALEYLHERPVEVDLPDLGPTIDLAEKLSARIESNRDVPAEDRDGEG